MSRGPGPAGPLRSPQGLDLDAEREKIRRQIEQLERSLQPGGTDVQLALSDSSLSSDGDDEDDDDEDSYAEMEVEVDGAEDSSDDDDDIESLPQDPETCLQMNHVYQDVIKEKIEEVELLIAQNRAQQKEIVGELHGSKTAKAGDGRNLAANVFLGHFLKPYFKDKITGIGPPSNEDAKEKAAQGIKSFEQLHSAKWKAAEKTLLQKSVVSDRLQRLLQPKLLKLSYWNQKLEKITTETEKQSLEKQIKDLEQEIEAINQLPESDLIGNRFDEHDWDKISNIHFDGQRSSEELRQFWQNWEHPSINKKEWTEEELERLKQIAAEHNCLDWQAIAQELGTNRTPFQCLQKYQLSNKDLKRKEWTKDEDQMLLELVQEMRVGSHIPYKKIAYYMEGRDSAQLIYRWTKSVDPSLKKGPWTPKEDAMLMAAVKKYKGKSWYKIRTEVPGRSDAQCRDRYLKSLHCDVKKGKWSLEEEEQLIELVQKHGLGRWSKIASELPHRTGAQCLSKWKLMIGSKKKRSEASKRRHAEERSSPSESSSEEDMELADSSEEEVVTSSTRKKFAVPSIDLWIPTGTETEEAARERCQIQSLLSAAGADAGSSCSDLPRAGGDGDRAADKSSELNTLLMGIGCPHSTDVLVKNPAEVMAKASQSGKHVLRVSLEDMRAILNKNMSFQRKLMLRPLTSLLARPPGVAAASGQDDQRLLEFSSRAQLWSREHWKSLNLDRKLLLAMTPWVGNVLLPRTLQAGRMAFQHTKAAAIHEKIKSVNLSSTPLFVLLIQLLQIDTKGCMKVIKERKLRQLELLKANVRSPQQASQNTETSSGSSSQACSKRNSQQGMPKRAVRKTALKGARARAVQGQRQRMKTVSELLQEKRLRQSQAKAAMQKTVVVAPRVLVSGPLIIQHPAQQIIPSAQPAAAAGTDGQVQGSQVPTRTSAAGSASAPVPENHSSAVPETGESPACSQGTDLQSSKELKKEVLESSPEGRVSPGVSPAAAEKAPDQGGCNGQVTASSSASAVLQNQAFVPQQIRVVALGLDSGTKKLSLPTPVTCELKSNRPQQRPVRLQPAPATPQAASPVIPSSILPFRWVVTPQGLLPSPVQTVVGVPQGMPAAPGGSQGWTAVTSNGNVSALGGTPVPAEANPPHPSSAETKGPSSQLAGVPLGKAADQNTNPLPVTPVSAGCTTSSISAVTPARSDGSCTAPDSSAAPAAPPAASPALCAVVLPQTQPPASTQGSGSQPVPSLSVGRSSDSITTNGSSSNPGSLRRGVVLWERAAAPHSNVPGSSARSGAQARRNRPIASKPPSTDVPPQPSTSHEQKNLLDFSLISLEDQGLVKEWLSGKQGVQVPSLQTRLPYLPPFLCSIKTLSKLLLQKTALEEQAASLLPSEASGDGGTGDVFHAVGELVQQKLGDNPAYLLLKARFLAAFTLPAVLATLPPPRVTTTLSAIRQQLEESDDEEWQREKKLFEEESCGNEFTGVQEDWRLGDEPGVKDADLLNQDMGAEESPAQSASGSCTDVADATAPQSRRSARFKKRRRT
ncbi:snRNA-activating protein complex subunit 4 isoform X1 [Onychostruthus taczanowskii]|uniref:snRNA-activating protein complex subunit 4 isoform X1 n=1 Tax=Onychostruthus taczanowskii TaxID=356909 RepID=UPI001B80D5EF|nr:snRNA-activating protein complex subunit 4 isoform X1 [Onychostruthus taczanowskii]XP_041262391.1 snRNA-activating protein complex subunit 4 isoform X1 [Onychostruthus taczanowskii]XP_041262392.1 snRNA-activating protein complex subunit 4 isoform X1 [Onychostruthus taczanowskii]